MLRQHANGGALAGEGDEDKGPVEGVDEEGGEFEYLTARELDAEEAEETKMIEKFSKIAENLA